MNPALRKALASALAQVSQQLVANQGPQAVTSQVQTGLQPIPQHQQSQTNSAPRLHPPPTSSRAPALPGPPSTTGTRASTLRGRLAASQAATAHSAPTPAGSPAPPPVASTPPVNPQLITSTILAQATSALNSAIASGQLDQMIRAFVQYQKAEDEDQFQQLQQTMSPKAAANLMMTKRAQAEQENITLLSNISAMEHQTRMAIINNIR